MTAGRRAEIIAQYEKLSQEVEDAEAELRILRRPVDECERRVERLRRERDRAFQEMFHP